mgnify:CR=1 FL=1
MTKHIHLAALLLALTLSACGGGGSGGDTPAALTPQSSPPPADTASNSSEQTDVGATTTPKKLTAADFAGTWEACARWTENSVSKSSLDTITFTERSEVQLDVESRFAIYSSGDCSGDPDSVSEVSGTGTLTGPQSFIKDPLTKNYVRAERIDLVIDGFASFQVLALSGDILRLGNIDSLGFSGYPELWTPGDTCASKPGSTPASSTARTRALAPAWV